MAHRQLVYAPVRPLPLFVWLGPGQSFMSVKGESGKSRYGSIITTLKNHTDEILHLDE